MCSVLAETELQTVAAAGLGPDLYIAAQDAVREMVRRTRAGL